MIQEHETKELAWTARIAVEDEVIPEFQNKINQKLDYYAVIADAPTNGVPKTVNPSRLKTVLRNDTVIPSMDVLDALRNAPEVQETSFKIPRIL